jgi:hypothetical protein
LNVSVNPLDESLDFRTLKSAGFVGIGMEVDQLPSCENKLMAVFEKLAQRCEQAGVYSCIKDVSSLSMLSAALASGFSYICGPAVAPALDCPRGVIPYDAAAMFKFTAKKWAHGGA